MDRQPVETRTDEDIKADVVEQLHWDDRVDASGIQVTVNDRLVTLNGSVISQRARAAAGDDASVVRNVLAVKNRLEVEAAPESVGLTDEELQEGIGNLFRLDSELGDAEISVRFEDGVATLEGSVTAHWEKTRAQELAAGFNRVREIRNLITVVPTEEVADQTVAREVTRALERDASTNDHAMTVEVEDGVVTLTGTVPKWQAFSAAARIASQTSGVKDVENRLVVYP